MPTPKKKTPTKKTAKKAAPKKAVQNIAAPDAPSRSETTSIRKIQNGWIVTQDTFDPKKGYKTKETFTTKKPKFEITI